MGLCMYMGVRLSTNGYLKVRDLESILSRMRVLTLVEVPYGGKPRVLWSEVR